MVNFRRLSPFVADSRANRVGRFLVAKLAEGDDGTRWLYIFGPTEAGAQIEMVGGSACVAVEPNDQFVADYSHCYRFDEGLPQDVLDLVRLLEEVFSLTRRSSLDCAIALDWYKKPHPDLDPQQWPNTDVGELVYRAKYYTSNDAKRREAAGELLRRVVAVVQSHPLYRDAPIIVTVPGHKADGNSVGEGFARAVGRETKKLVVETISVNGARPASKEGASGSLRDAFKMPQTLSGDVIVIDDVYRSGETMSSVALAARRAGAQRVFGLVAVRTLRN
ncbi:hypothetical protein NE236_37005 [Actinoallomurus purpureus]|uniref:hypothetical protein n=1 Tax=Actinoallomurus purpureus TaxID=478114 RepID=UPI002092998E|nr:hypothetical protein [Actinoallomurus purpureus]MCO6010573.1 hypothetical protein [Actinoallomurus purpureus]